MRWFKHVTDNHRGQSQQYFLDELGHFGPCGYYFLVEMCAEKLERLPDREVTAADCEFRFHRRVVESALRAKLAAVVRLLDAGSSCNLLNYEVQGDFILIKMPKLLELLDYDSKRSRRDRAKVAPISRQESESYVESESESELEKNKKKEKTKIVALPIGRELVATYCEAFKEKYHTNPDVLPKDAKNLKRFAEAIGLERARTLVRAYFEMNNQWFITKRHDVASLLSNVNAVTQFADTGKSFTNAEIRSVDTAQTNFNTLQQLRAGKV